MPASLDAGVDRRHSPRPSHRRRLAPERWRGILRRPSREVGWISGNRSSSTSRRAETGASLGGSAGLSARRAGTRRELGLRTSRLELSETDSTIGGLHCWAKLIRGC